MKTTNKKISTLQLVEMAILLALVIVLQSVSSFGVIPICLCLVPITLGAIVLDWRCGAILGFVFGLVALFWGIVGKDQFTLFLFQANPVMTIFICIVKGSLAGMIPGVIYSVLKKLNVFVASIVAAVTAPIINTGVFALGCLIIRSDVISVAGRIGIETANFMTLLFGVLITVNFFVELLINIVFAPSLYKIEQIVNKRLKGYN